MFDNDDKLHCPTTTYTIEISPDNGATFEAYTGDLFYLQPYADDQNARLVTKSHVTHKNRIWIKANTHAGKFSRVSFRITVCDAVIAKATGASLIYQYPKVTEGTLLKDMGSIRQFFNQPSDQCDRTYTLEYQDPKDRGYYPATSFDNIKLSGDTIIIR
jgi:hypothetical protein